MDYDFFSFIGGEDNNSLTNLFRTENDDNEVDNPVSNFTKHSIIIHSYPSYTITKIILQFLA